MPGDEPVLVQKADLVEVVNPEKIDDEVNDCVRALPADRNGVNLQRCGVLRLLRFGNIGDVQINRDGVIAVELVDDSLRHVAVIDPGIDGRWGRCQRIRRM